MTIMAHGQGGAEISQDRAPTLTCNHEAPIAVYSLTFCDANGRRSDRPDGGLYITENPETSPTLTTQIDSSIRVLQHAYGFQPRIARNGRGDMGDVVSALTAEAGETGKGDSAPCVAIAFDSRQECISSTEVFGALGSSSPQAQAVATGGMAVRRLTPRECERLQGFPDNYTAVPVRKANVKAVVNGNDIRLVDGVKMVMAADAPRYKALGNSMCTHVMAYIGRKIQEAASYPK